MIKFILFIFFFILLLGFLAGFSIIRAVRNALFGPPPNARNAKQQQRKSSGKNTSRTQAQSAPPPRKKIFAKDEGEYIDYEEVK
jgi:hypothetical protein